MLSPHRTEAARDILSSAAFRLTLRFATVFVACLLVLDIGLGAGVAWYVKRDAKAAADQLIEELETIADAEGAAAVLAFIGHEAEEIDDSDLAVGYQSPDGVLLAGGLAIPAPQLGWITFTPHGIDADEALWVRSVRLRDGSWLNVGAESEFYHDIRELMLAGALWTIAIAFPLALLSGALLSRAVLARLAPISATANGVREGALSRRAPITGAGDEFDRLAQNINAMLEQIEVLTRNLRNVSVGIAHELRTPLARIKNRLVGLRETGAEKIAAEAALAEIETALATFDALLKIGQIEADAQRKGFDAMDLAELVEELAEAYEPVAAEHEKGLSARCNCSVRITGNRALLAQMISNLLENAIEHTPSGTNITLSLDQDGGGRHALIVEDNGPGIPEEERDKVFERFYRLSRSRGTPGSGLGLSLVQSICALHGFRIRLTDAMPGARFVIEL